MLFDTKQKGLNTLFKPYQIIILHYLWDENKVKEGGINSAQAFSYLEQFPERKSRAAVINFMNAMVTEGILTCKSESCKGGYRRIYNPAMNETDFAEYICNIINIKLRDVFPNIFT